MIHGFLDSADGLEVRLDSDKDVLTSPSLREFDVLLFGTGFTRAVVQPDGGVLRERDLTPAQEDGLFDFVAGGKGLVGVHGTGWWVDARAVALIGGHANWHPPGLTFTVKIEDSSHPVTRGVSDFEVEDEIYMSAWDPAIRILASAEWSEKTHPHGVGQALRGGPRVLHDPGPHRRHLPPPRHAEAHHPGRALGGIEMKEARLMPGARSPYPESDCFCWRSFCRPWDPPHEPSRCPTRDPR